MYTSWHTGPKCHKRLNIGVFPCSHAKKAALLGRLFLHYIETHSTILGQRFGPDPPKTPKNPVFSTFFGAFVGRGAPHKGAKHVTTTTNAPNTKHSSSSTTPQERFKSFSGGLGAFFQKGPPAYLPHDLHLRARRPRRRVRRALWGQKPCSKIFAVPRPPNTPPWGCLGAHLPLAANFQIFFAQNP